jgi:hypothetical protein
LVAYFPDHDFPGVHMEQEFATENGFTFGDDMKEPAGQQP